MAKIAKEEIVEEVTEKVEEVIEDDNELTGEIEYRKRI